MAYNVLGELVRLRDLLTKEIETMSNNTGNVTIGESIRDTAFRTRTFKGLKSIGVDTWEQLETTPDSTLRQIPGLGDTCMREIHRALKAKREFNDRTRNYYGSMADTSRAHKKNDSIALAEAQRKKGYNEA